MPYLSLTDEEKKAMLDRVGVRSFDELYLARTRARPEAS